MGAVAGRPTVSLCMIVRDEAEDLPRCLDSVGGLFDEIVVVDTGSADRTPEIARERGASVHRHPWRHDFAEARNRSLDLARGDWVMVLDADEELAPEDRDPERLRRLLEAPGVEGYLFRVLNLTGRPEDGTAEVSAALRLFRNRPAYRFTGALHEQVGETILRHAPGSLAVSGLRILHYGYLDGITASRGKRERNLAIALAQAAAHPGDAFVRFNLGVELHRLRRHEEAVAAYREAAAGLLPGATWGSKLYKVMAQALLHLGRTGEALAAVETGLRAYPDYTDLVYLRGVALFMEKRHPRALEAFRRCLAMGDAPVPPHAAAEAGLGGGRAWFALGMVQEDLGNLVEAIEAYQNAYLTGGRRLGPLERIAGIVVPRERPEAVRAYFERFFDLSRPDHLLALADLLAAAGGGGPELALPYLDAAEAAGAPPAAVALRRGRRLTPAGESARAPDAPRHGSDAPAMGSPSPRLSLCMIVRDEAEDLPRCLESAAGIADELIVVDTGSADRTPEIARAYGARVHSVPWRGDFAAVRNAALDRAGGDWILCLDADEVLHPDDRPRVRDLLDAPGIEGYYLRVINYFGPAPGGDASTDLRLSLFRNRPTHRFRRPIHEDVAESIAAAGGAVAVAPVRILHHGYLDGHLARKDKRRRNAEILARALASAPGDPFLHYALAVEHMERNDFRRALERLGRARAAWDGGAPHLPDVIKKLAVCERKLGRLEAALDHLDEGIRRYPDFTDLWYLRGAVHHQMGRREEAVRDFRHCLELGEAPPRYASWEGVGTFRARRALGVLGADPGGAAAAPGTPAPS